MKRTILCPFRYGCIALWIALSMGPAGAESKREWRAGVAKSKITPETPLWLAGYAGRDHAAEGKVHDLWVKALVLEDAEGRRAVLVTSDILGFSRVMVEAIEARLHREFGLKRDQVMLTSSHTHCGPVVRESLLDYYPLDDRQLLDIENYSKGIENTVTVTIGDAIKKLEVVTISAGEGEAGFAVNRRNNAEAEVPKMIETGVALKGPVDHTVPVLAVKGPDGKPRAIVFGYACHSTTLAFYQWCGDYPGFAQIRIEADHPGAIAMFHAGCGADQNPLPRRSVELCQKYGAMLASGVERALAAPMREVEPTLQTASRVVDLPYEKVTTREELEKNKSAEGVRGRWARNLLAKLDAGETFDSSYPYRVQAWKLGEHQLWISLAGEAVVDYALRLKAEHGAQTWVTAYAHHLVAYVPSRRVWDEGGYEGGSLYEYGLPAERWTPDVEDRIFAGINELLARTR